MTQRPDYKKHPLWNDAMVLTREVYAIADSSQCLSLEASKRLRKAAVSVPAHVASAICSTPDRRIEHMIAARGALAGLSREVGQADVDGGDRLARRAADLDRSVLFEFGASETIS